MTTFAADDFDAIREAMKKLREDQGRQPCQACEDAGWIFYPYAATHNVCHVCNNPNGKPKP